MNITVSTEEARKGFYPTPPSLAEELVSGIDWRIVQTVLEPSAGTGSLVEAIGERFAINGFGWDRSSRIEVDCIEIDPCLRAILEEKFSDKTVDALHERRKELAEKQRYRDFEALSPEEEQEKKALDEILRQREAIQMRVVHDDFCTFESRKKYDLIVMNPPFSEGDTHLLKAISLLEPYGGRIRCILNAETLRNPCTNLRKLLAQKLEALHAGISFQKEMFLDADRPTAVEVAIIQIHIPEPDYAEDEGSLYHQMRKAAQLPEDEPEITDICVTDFLESKIAQFNLEVSAGLRLIQEYRAMRPFILRDMDEKSIGNGPILQLCVGIPGRGMKDELPSVNDYLRKVRSKYWLALLTNDELISKMTSNLSSKYRAMAASLKDYDFTMFNIQKVIVAMNAEMTQGVQDTILDLFETMTVEHTYYPECRKNVWLFNGWKSNKAHKIAQKVILPVNGLFSDYSWCKTFDVGKAYKTLSDIEKALNYLAGDLSANVNLHAVLTQANEQGVTKNIHCKYFDVTFFKKGTMHIKFTDLMLLDRFNIYCARQRRWLPPDYGHKKYEELDTEEQAVIDSFHGDDTPGSGKVEYQRVMVRAGYYLAPANSNNLALPGTQEQF